MQPRKEFIESLIHKYERYAAPFTFLGGFLLDTFTLQRIDLWLDHVILLIYLLLAGGSIIALNAYEAGRIRFRLFEHAVPFLPVVMQFGFGGLFSAFVIFYTASGTIPSSWLFLLVLALILIGNERFRKRYQRLVFQLSIFFVAIFSYAIFLVPLVFKKLGVAMFLLSGAVSLLFIGIFILLLSFSLSKQIRESRRTLALSLGTIFILFNIFYFANIIPPIPLSTKEIGVYHSVRRLESGAYAVQFEKAPWYLPLETTSRIYHWKAGDAVYVYSAVFAPTKITVPILHHWFRYDEVLKQWVGLENIKFSIYGGRDGGYRGYSYKTAIMPGRWRVDVITEEGQVLGRQSFTVVETNGEPELETALR